MINFVKSIKSFLKNKVLTEIKERRNNFEKRLSFQESLYSINNLNRKSGLKLLNQVLHQEKLDTYNETLGMYSEHLIMFAAISCNEDIQINSILEIGTFDGITALLLSKLFPKAQISTIDLDDNDPIFKNIYDRKNKIKRMKFIEKRNLRLLRMKNIKFYQMNSLEITIDSLENNKFDLIWVDGAHGYPYVCSDITNAIRLSHEKTILMCDDIWKNLKNSDTIYSSIAAWETLQSFSQAKILTTNYFYKRLGKKFLSSEKFVSLSRLIMNKKQ